LGIRHLELIVVSTLNQPTHKLRGPLKVPVQVPVKVLLQWVPDPLYLPRRHPHVAYRGNASVMSGPSSRGRCPSGFCAILPDAEQRRRTDDKQARPNKTLTPERMTSLNLFPALHPTWNRTTVFG